MKIKFIIKENLGKAPTSNGEFDIKMYQKVAPLLDIDKNDIQGIKQQLSKLIAISAQEYPGYGKNVDDRTGQLVGKKAPLRMAMDLIATVGKELGSNIYKMNDEQRRQLLKKGMKEAIRRQIKEKYAIEKEVEKGGYFDSDEEAAQFLRSVESSRRHQREVDDAERERQRRLGQDVSARSDSDLRGTVVRGKKRK